MKDLIIRMVKILEPIDIVFYRFYID